MGPVHASSRRAMRSPAGGSTPLAIEVAGLARSFGDTTGARRGGPRAWSRVGSSGCWAPNGAGKTTTVRILTGVLRPDRAVRLRVLGHDLPDQIASGSAAHRRADRHRPVRPAHRPGQPHVLRPALRHGRRGCRECCARAAGPVRSGRPAGRPGRHLLQGHEAEDADRAGPHRRSGAGLPRRADGGPGPRGGARADDLHPRPVHRAGPHVLHHLPPPRGDGVGLHQGGGALRRPDRGPGRTRRGRAHCWCPRCASGSRSRPGRCSTKPRSRPSTASGGSRRWTVARSSN